MHSKENQMVTTPISRMMELESWQSNKIGETQVNKIQCPQNILSAKLLKILDLPQDETSLELLNSMASNATELIGKIMAGLAANMFSNLGHMDGFNPVEKLTKLHGANIRGMTAQILEKVLVTHAEQNKLAEVKKLINNSQFLKSVVICACEV